MQNPHDTLPQIIQPAQVVMQLPKVSTVQPDREGINGEVAPAEVVVDRPRLDGRQSAGVLIGL